MKTTEKTCFIAAIILLAIVVILLPLKLMVFNNSYYYSQFEHNGVYENINKTEVDKVIDNLLFFFQEKEDLKYFSEDEQSHLQDVKIAINRLLFTLNTLIIAFFVMVIALFFSNKEKFLDNFFKLLFLGGISGFVLLILLFLASLNFSITFDRFHILFFPQGNYTFAETSLLITLFPEAFFKSFFLKLLLISLLVSFGLMVPQFILHRLKD